MAGFDFYSMNALIKAIDSATLEECKAQLKTCVEYSKDQSVDGGKRLLWAEFAKIIRKQIKKY